MEQRHLGRTGLRVSRIGLGTLTWGRDTDEHDAADQLKAFWEAGGTLVDTADVYGGRRGRVPAGPARWKGSCRGGTWSSPPRRAACPTRTAASTARAAICSPRWTPPWSGSARTTSTCGRCTPSTRRHRWRRPSRRSTSRSAAAGRATSGVSNFCGWQLAKAATWQLAAPGTRTRLASTQMEYSLLQRGVEREVLPAALDLGIGLLPSSPLGRGVLTGKYRTATAARLAGRVGAAGAVRRAVSRRGGEPDRGRGGDGGRRAGRRPRSRWRWRGCATGRAWPRRSSARATRSSSRRHCQWRPLVFLTRSAGRSTMCRRRCTAIPTRTGARCDRSPTTASRTASRAGTRAVESGRARPPASVPGPSRGPERREPRPRPQPRGGVGREAASPRSSSAGRAARAVVPGVAAAAFRAARAGRRAPCPVRSLRDRARWPRGGRAGGRLGRARRCAGGRLRRRQAAESAAQTDPVAAARASRAYGPSRPTASRGRCSARSAGPTTSGAARRSSAGCWSTPRWPGTRRWSPPR